MGNTECNEVSFWFPAGRTGIADPLRTDDPNDETTSNTTCSSDYREKCNPKMHLSERAFK